jgi:uncharacterized protein (UPF0332 family)
MKPESAKYIEQANVCIARAGVMMTVRLHEDAARTAYLASFHAAQAYIFEREVKRAVRNNLKIQIQF